MSKSHFWIARIAMSVALTTFLFLITFLVIYPELKASESEVLIYVPLTSVAIVIGTYSFLWVRKYSREKDELYRRTWEYERILGGETSTFRVLDALKETEILTDSGDAIIRYSARCINNPETELKRIRISVSHDGKLDESSLKCTVDGRESKISDIVRLETYDLSTKKLRKPLSNELRFRIVPIEPVASSARFEYGYSYKIEGIYKDMKKDESTGMIILHPTRRLHYSVKSPPGFIFKSYEPRVLDREEIENVAEVERIRKECFPFVTSDRMSLVWDLQAPQLGNIYRLHFNVEQINVLNRREEANS